MVPYVKVINIYSFHLGTGKPTEVSPHASNSCFMNASVTR